MALMSIGKFSEAVGLTQVYLRMLHKSGELVPAKISSKGHRYYSTEQLNDYLEKDNKDKPVILYARVSTKPQEDDLNRQIENLKSYACAKGYNFEVITDIGSGINYSKDGLKKVIKKINDRQISKIVILYKDRLVRFGFELIEYLAEINQIDIEIVDNSSKSKEEELTDDLIQIITVFANRLYGQRSKKTKRLLDEVKSS